MCSSPERDAYATCAQTGRRRTTSPRLYSIDGGFRGAPYFYGMRRIVVLPVFVLFILLCSIAQAQDPLSLEKIWSSRALFPQSAGSFNFMKDGRHYTRLQQNAIVKYDLLTGNKVETLLEGDEALRIQSYTFSDNERYILVGTDRESIYRYSSRARYYVWDREQKQRYPVSASGKQMYATFSPDGRQVAFVRDNDLWISQYMSGQESRVTHDGEKNRIINGASDWVYEEEFSLVRAFEWSPDGTRIAYWRFDESEVPEFTMTLYHDKPYPEYETFKYPKVGEANALVEIRVYDLPSGETFRLGNGPVPEQYIPRIAWTRNPRELCVFLMNRHQNDLQLMIYDVHLLHSRPLLHETNKRFIDIHDDLRFLADGKHFIWSSEQSGYKHLYLYDMTGKLVRPLTSGDWEVTSFYGVDEANGLVYFQAAKESALRREVYAAPLAGGEPVLVRGGKGVTGADFSATFDYFVSSHSTINSPRIYQVCRRDGSLLREIEDNGELARQQKEHGVQPVEFFEFTTSEGVTLNGWWIKPVGFDPGRTYPVLMYLYGGPGSQEVIDSWRGANYWWFQMLAQEGYMVACVDNRGTGGRGEEFKKMTYLQLGHYETIDQIEAAKWLGSQPFVDKERIGIFGWSYGGYMSSLCLLKGNDVFKAAIAVAPVTNWKWYDTIYTERYMRTEGENPDGYRQNSPVYFADRLKGNYLLIHGMADDNVHFQNAVEMANALINANMQFETYYYPNRNHGIGGGYARLHLYTKMTEFVKAHLGK